MPRAILVFTHGLTPLRAVDFENYFFTFWGYVKCKSADTNFVHDPIAIGLHELVFDKIDVMMMDL